MLTHQGVVCVLMRPLDASALDLSKGRISTRSLSYASALDASVERTHQGVVCVLTYADASGSGVTYADASVERTHQHTHASVMRSISATHQLWTHQHTHASVMRQHTHASAHASALDASAHTRISDASSYVSIRQMLHSTHQHTHASVMRPLHLLHMEEAYVSIRQHTSASSGRVDASSPPPPCGGGGGGCSAGVPLKLTYADVC
jgi:hypothetical protein